MLTLITIESVVDHYREREKGHKNYLPRFSIAEFSLESLSPGCNLIRICSINLKFMFEIIVLLEH